MLDVRVYRTAFLPALVALFVAAFSLTDRPVPMPSPLAADAFDGARAFASLQDLGRAFPSRRAGSVGDDGLAERVARTLGAVNPATGRPDFQVRREVADGRIADGRGELETVAATRPGLTSRRIVVLADRDALDRPGLASLSATAGLLELARVLKGRDMRKTLVLVSTSGATTGFAGARAWAQDNAGAPVDAVLVLGDLAGARVHKPWVVPWPASSAAPPLALQRTVEAAVRAEVGPDPGAARASGQWARRALPLTASQQGPVGAAGLPSVMLALSGERGPRPRERVLRSRIEEFGRAALRAVMAIDAAGAVDGDRPAFAGSPAGLVTRRNVLPDWAVRTLVGTLLLPALLATLDGWFRARRRHLPVGRWLAWLSAFFVPLPAAWLWARLLGFTGALGAPDGFVLPGAFPLRAGGIAALSSAAVAGLLAWLGARTLLVARRPPRAAAAAGGLSAAVGLLTCGSAALVWVANPYAAALLLPAAHVWLFAAAPSSRLRGWRAAAAVAAGLVLPVLTVLHLAFALSLGPVSLAWATLLAVSGGGAMLGTVLWGAALGAALAGLLGVVRARGRIEAAAGEAAEPTIRTRGPLNYAGPGSLGGTESALRR